jgi:hypothetical protein
MLKKKDNHLHHRSVVHLLQLSFCPTCITVSPSSGRLELEFCFHLLLSRRLEHGLQQSALLHNLPAPSLRMSSVRCDRPPSTSMETLLTL